MAEWDKETYGSVTRRKREELQIGLREFAKMIGVSATYLSKVERDELKPPAEDKVIAIAEALDLDKDELLALAGRVASELTAIIREKPKEMASFLREAKGLTSEQLKRLAKNARKAKRKD